MLPVGSSPRVRGKRETALDKALTLRIIPARAGQTDFRRLEALPPSDHPRACGANPGMFSSRSVRAGSSPRVRGKRALANAWTPERRIIPARAGQTCLISLMSASSSDHPRACGANVDEIRGVTGESGSSPRVRGKQAEDG